MYVIVAWLAKCVKLSTPLRSEENGHGSGVGRGGHPKHRGPAADFLVPKQPPGTARNEARGVDLTSAK
jgi:hypothetical protein